MTTLLWILGLSLAYFALASWRREDAPEAIDAELIDEGIRPE